MFKTPKFTQFAADVIIAAKKRGILWRIPGHNRLFQLWERGYSVEQVVAHYGVGYQSPESEIGGGMDELRAKLGWV